MPPVLNFAAAALPGSGRNRLVPVELRSAVLGIVLMQAAYYVFLGMGLMLMLGVVCGREVHLADVFVDGSQTASAFIAVGFAHAVMVGPMTVVMALAVQHVTQVLDHVVSLQVLHALLRWGAGYGFPTAMGWWLLAALDVVVLSIVGEVACARRDAYRIAAVSQAMDRQGDAPQGREVRSAPAGASSSMAVSRRGAAKDTPSGSPLITTVTPPSAASPVSGPAPAPSGSAAINIPADPANKRA
jgi:hypothetical protein